MIPLESKETDKDYASALYFELLVNATSILGRLEFPRLRRQHSGQINNVYAIRRGTSRTGMTRVTAPNINSDNPTFTWLCV